MEKKLDTLSIIIPVYNSENTIELVINQIIEVLANKIKYEIILVNDGSKDNSYQKCIKLANQYNFLKFINLSKNFGQHNAIIAGLRFASGQLILFMDDDLQTPPVEIWKLIDKLNEGYDVVYANYIEKYHNKLQNLGSLINDKMLCLFLKKPPSLKITSFFIIRRFLADEIIKYEGPFPYLGGLILRATNNIGIVTVQHSKRLYGKSNYSFFKLINLWLNGFTNFSIKPLRISFFLGLFFSIISFLFSIALVIRKLIDTNVYLGWTSLIVAILFFSGIQLILVGLVGEYVGRVFLSINKQPQYVIKEKYNINNNFEKK